MKVGYALCLALVALGGCRDFLGGRGDVDPRVVCRANLKGVGKALHIYVNENFERFGNEGGRVSPPDLQTLVRAGQLHADTTRCPHARSGRAAYILLPEMITALDGDPRNVLGYERPGNHDIPGLNVLFADAHSQWMTVEAFEKALAETKKRLGSK